MNAPVEVAEAGAAASAEAPSAPPWRTRTDSLLTKLIVMVGALTLTVNTTMVALVFFTRGTLGASAASYGLIEATWTGAMLIGGWLAAWRTRGDGGQHRRRDHRRPVGWRRCPAHRP